MRSIVTEAKGKKDSGRELRSRKIKHKKMRLEEGDVRNGGREGMIRRESGLKQHACKTVQ